jgi:hypothetical protein
MYVCLSVCTCVSVHVGISRAMVHARSQGNGLKLCLHAFYSTLTSSCLAMQKYRYYCAVQTRCKWLRRALTLGVSETSRRALEASILGVLKGSVKMGCHVFVWDSGLVDERVTGVHDTFPCISHNLIRSPFPCSRPLFGCLRHRPTTPPTVTLSALFSQGGQSVPMSLKVWCEQSSTVP